MLEEYRSQVVPTYFLAWLAGIQFVKMKGLSPTHWCCTVGTQEQHCPKHTRSCPILPPPHTFQVLSESDVTQQVCYGISRLLQSLFARQFFLSPQCLSSATSNIQSSSQLTMNNYYKFNWDGNTTSWFRSLRWKPYQCLYDLQVDLAWGYLHTKGRFRKKKKKD